MVTFTAVKRLKKVPLFLWKWLNIVVFWSPALRRNFLTDQSKPLYESFQRTVFLFPQLTRVFVALGFLNLTLLVYSSAVQYEHKCSNLIGPVSQSLSLTLHVAFLLIRWRVPSTFRRCHILFECVSVSLIAFTTDWVTHCAWVSEFGVLRVTFAAFFMLVVTIYFQYSTLMTVVFSVYRISSPLLAYHKMQSAITPKEVTGWIHTQNVCLIL